MSRRGLVVVSVLGLSAPALVVGLYLGGDNTARQRVEKQLETAKPATSEEKDMIKNSIGMKLKLIPAGSFLMGATPGDAEAKDQQNPQHKVTITGPFYLGVYEVTQHEYKQVMGVNPSGFLRDSELLPVEKVSWLDAVTFCNKLSEREGRLPYYEIDGRTVTILGGNGYRLPTEAEWEYACRAPRDSGGATKHPFGNDESELASYAWFRGIGEFETHPVGQKKPNRWGLYDMQGNVWEWCQDWFGENYYKQSPAEDPRGPMRGAERVLRGGCWFYPPYACRPAYRDFLEPEDRSHDSVGFRVAGVQE
jgi:formylglycine-generating enzyme required for sulfatase activity